MQIGPNTLSPPANSSNASRTSPSRLRLPPNGRAVSVSPPHSRPLHTATAAAASLPLEKSFAELSISRTFQLEEPFLAILTSDHLLAITPPDLTRISNSVQKVLGADTSSRSFVDLATTKLPLIQKALCDRELIDKICCQEQTIWPQLSLACGAIIQPEVLFRVISQCSTDQNSETLKEFRQFWTRENTAKPSTTEQTVLASSNQINVLHTLTEICRGRIKPSTYAKEIANDLLAQQVSFYLSLSEHDLMPCKYQMRPPIVQEWINHINRLTEFVIDTILFMPKDCASLNRLASFFVDVGLHALNSGDFTTARALLGALDNAHVLRLLSPDLKKSDSYCRLDELSVVSLLRQKIAASSQHVPLLIILEGDLARLSEMQAVITESDGSMHYNYHKLQTACSLITNFLRAQPIWKALAAPTTTIVASYLSHIPKNDDLRKLCSDTWKPPVVPH